MTEFNRGKPLHCTYRIRIRPQREDWIVFIRFTRLKVGEPSPDRQTCTSGYVQIVDGYRDSNYSNKETSGSNKLDFSAMAPFCLFSSSLHELTALSFAS